MLKRSRVSAATLSLFGGGALVAALPVFAQEVQRVEITGSNIKRIDAETADPVQVLTRQDIKRTGATTIKQLIDSLPSATTTLSDIAGSNSFASGASAASLRNLGKQSTLILLNGRRVSPYGLADYNEVFTNLDSLPLAAVERIEILKNGASAIYGSDAVAGVINIITLKNYNGLEAGISYEESLTSRTFKEKSGEAKFGFGDLNADKYNVLATVELYKRDSVVWRDILEYMNPTTYQYIPQTLATQYSTYSYPGTVLTANGPIAVAGCPPELLIDGICRYDRYARFEAIPKADRANVMLAGTFLLGGDLELFTEATWSRTKTTYLGVNQPYGIFIGPTVWGNPATGDLKTFTPRGLPAGHPLNPTGEEVEFRYRFSDANALSTTTADTYRWLAGLRGTFGKYDWESAIGVLGSKVKDRQRGAFSDSGFKQVIGDYTQDVLSPDFFNQPGGYVIGGPNTSEVLNTLFPTYGQSGETRQIWWDGKVSGEIMPMNGGSLGFAAGLDLRHETFKITASENIRNGDIVGFGDAETDASRNFGAVFGELSIPLAKTLTAQVAGRVDKFPNFNAHFSPKLGLAYKPVPELLLRGSVEQGFRAPNLTEAANSNKYSFEPGVSDPARCPQARTLADDLLAQAAGLPDSNPQKALLQARADTVVNNECSASIFSVAGGNPDLKPEESTSVSLGILFEPTREFSMSLDYWNIKRKNEIGIKTSQELLSSEVVPPAEVSRGSLATDPSFTAAERALYGVTEGPLNAVTTIFENVSRTKTSGVDVGANVRFKTAIGQLDLGVAATYLIEYRAFSTVINAYGDNLAGRYLYPRKTGNFTAELKSGNFTNGFRVRHVDSYALRGDYFDDVWTNEGCAANFGLSETGCRVPTSTLFDYYISYEGIKNLTIGAYVANLFDQRPPADIRALFESGGGIIPQEPGDAQRRTLKLTLSYKFF